MRAFLYDATGTDKEVTLNAFIVTELHNQQLLWVDVGEPEEKELRQLASLLSLTRESVYTLLQTEYRPRLDNYDSYSQLNINTIQEVDGNYKLVELDFVFGSNFVLTVHRQPVEFLQSFDQRVKGDSNLGQLDAPAFMTTLLDWHITSYFRLIEALDHEVDKIDAQALRPSNARDLLADLAKLRYRVAFVRRTLTPHREVYSAMARRDFHLIAKSDSAAHFTLLQDRLERAIEAVENARELLIGSFDIFTTQTALRTNEAMKALTLVSVTLLPATVIIGISSCLVESPVYQLGQVAFWAMLVLIASIAAVTLVVARRRRWI